MPGLRLVDQSLSALLERAEDAARRRAVLAGVELAVRVTQLHDERVATALGVLRAEADAGQPEESRIMTQFAEELDEEAWDLQQRVDQGLLPTSKYEEAFRKARAAAAVGFAFEDDSRTAAEEALYEAHHAIQDLARLRETVLAAMD